MSPAGGSQPPSAFSTARSGRGTGSGSGASEWPAACGAHGCRDAAKLERSCDMLLRPASAWIWERASTAGPRRAREHETIRDSLARGRVVIMRGHCPGLVSHVVALAILVSHCTPTSVSTSVSALGKLCSPGPPRAQGGVQDVFVRVLAAHNSSIGPCAALTRQFEPGSRGSAQMRLRGGWGLSWVRSSRGAGDANNDAGSDADGVQPRKYGSTPSPPR